MKHILILTGGYLNLEFAKNYYKTLSVDKVFAVDKGLEYADLLGIPLDFIVGDFDTVNQNLLDLYEQRIETGELNIYLERHPVKKDATDTELAVWRAMEEHADRITVLAGTGTRIDHVLANIGLLLQTSEKHVDCQIVDENNRIQLLMEGEECLIEKEKQYGDYLSVIPVTPTVTGLTMKGVMYPLEDKVICQGSSLTVSNQIVENLAAITVKEGKVLVIESKDA